MRYNLMPLQNAYLTGRENNSDRLVMREKESYELFCPEFDKEKFENAVKMLVQAHPILRSICTSDRKLELTNAGTAEISYIYVETPEQRLQEVQKFQEAFYEDTEYDRNAVPVRFQVICDSEKNASVITLTDGIAFDGESQQIMIRDLRKAYRNQSPEQDSGHILYEQACDLIDEEDYQQSENFWKNRLDTVSDAPVFYHEEHQKESYFQISRRLPKYFAESLFNTAKKYNLTSFSVLLAVYCKTIELYSERKDFSLNIPVSARPFWADGAENLLGLYADFTILNYEYEKNRTIESLALQLQKQLSCLMEYKYYSGTEILKSLSKVKGRNFQIPYTFTSLLDCVQESSEIFSRKSFQALTGGLHLETIIQPLDDEILLTMTGNRAFISEQTVKHMADVFINVCEEIMRSEMVLKQSELVISQEDLNIIQEANRTKRESYNISVAELLHNSLEKNDKDIAVITQNKTLSYNELRELIGKVQNLIRKNIGTERVRIGILLEKGMWQIVSELACACGGYVFLPIETEQPVENINYCIKNTGISAVISQNRFSGILENMEIRNIIFVDDAEKSEVCNIQYHYLMPDDEAFMISTSGSTGKPKSIVLRQEGFVSCLLNTSGLFDINENDTSIAVTNYCHDMAFFDMIFMIAYHGRVAVLTPSEEKEPRKWINHMINHSVTVWNSVPAFMEMLFASEDENLSRAVKGLQKIILGGDWIRPQLLKQIREINPSVRIFSVGGPSETTVWNIFHEVTEQDLQNSFIPYGKPFPNTEYHILDENHRLCPVYKRGTMYVSGAGVAKEYAGLSEETEKRFLMIDNVRMYSTGDAGMYLPDGNIRILGRDDFQVKINGKRIELTGIETAVRKYSDITGCVAVMHKKLNTLVGYYTSKKQIDFDTLKKFLKDELPAYMIPSHLIQIDEIPLTKNAKPDRKILEVMEFSHTEKKPSDIITIENPVKQKLFSMCRQILEDDTISPEDNFYFMGGDSISAMKLTAAVRKEYGVTLEVYDILNHPTLDDWTAMIEEAEKQMKSGTDETGMQILDICRMIFPDKEISMEDTLFSLGGTELSAKMLAGAIKSGFQVNITAYDILSRPFVCDWAELVKERT